MTQLAGRRTRCGLALAALALAAACSSDAPDATAPTAVSPVPPSTSTSAPSVPADPSSPPPSEPAAPASGTSSPGRPSSPPRPVAAGPAACATSALTVGLDALEGAAGSAFYDVTFRNAGTEPCLLDGHPGVSFVAGPDGQQIGAPAARTGDPGRVVLVPGGRAAASLRVSSADNQDPAACGRVAARGLRVYPPDQTASTFVPVALQACTAPATTLLTVGPVRAEG